VIVWGANVVFFRELSKNIAHYTYKYLKIK